MILKKRVYKISRQGNKRFEYLIQCSNCKSEKWYKDRHCHFGKRKFCSHNCINKGRKRSSLVREKTSKTLKKFYLKNEVWNKNLTKETNKSLKKASHTLRDPKGKFQHAIKKNEWKEHISESVKGEKNGFYGKTHSKEFKERQSQKRSEAILNGSYNFRKNNRGFKGWYFSEKNKEKFYYDSFWELLRMKMLDLDKNVISWTKRHGIKISYFKDFNHYYVPDFLVTYNDKKVLEEVKGYEDKNIKKIKLKKLKEYCKKNNFTCSIVQHDMMENLCKLYFNKNIESLRSEFKNNNNVIKNFDLRGLRLHRKYSCT